MANNIASILQDDDAEFDKLREESRQAEPPEPSPPGTSSPQAEAQTPPSPPPAEEKKDRELDLKNWVPLDKFLHEKQERQQLEKLHEELRERQARAEERLRILAEKFAAPAVPVPDKTQDPVGYLEHEIQQTKAPIQTLTQKLEQYEQRQQEQAQTQQMAAFVSQTEQEFSAKTPDYWNAIEHIRQARLSQYQLAGLNAQQQVQALYADTRNWTMALLQSGKNPAEATYELARAYGYSGAAAAPVAGEAPAPARNPDGTFAPVKQANPKVEKAKETLKTVERGQQAAKSLGDSPGGTASTEIPDLTELASMSDEEFDRLTSGKNWKKYWN